MEEIAIVAGITLTAYLINKRLYYFLSGAALIFYGLESYALTYWWLATAIIIFGIFTAARGKNAK